jgi:hypothetical protein
MVTHSLRSCAWTSNLVSLVHFWWRVGGHAEGYLGIFAKNIPSDSDGDARQNRNNNPTTNNRVSIKRLV